MIIRLENGQSVSVPDSASIEETNQIVSNVEMSNKDIGSLLFALKQSNMGIECEHSTTEDITPLNSPALSKDECNLVNMYRQLPADAAQAAYKMLYYMASGER